MLHKKQIKRNVAKRIMSQRRIWWAQEIQTNVQKHFSGFSFVATIAATRDFQQNVFNSNAFHVRYPDYAPLIRKLIKKNFTSAPVEQKHLLPNEAYICTQTDGWGEVILLVKICVCMWVLTLCSHCFVFEIQRKKKSHSNNGKKSQWNFLLQMCFAIFVLNIKISWNSCSFVYDVEKNVRINGYVCFVFCSDVAKKIRIHSFTHENDDNRKYQQKRTNNMSFFSIFERSYIASPFL